MMIITDKVIEEFKEDIQKTFGFKQVLFKSNDQYFVNFEGLKDGKVVEIRYNIKDEEYEIFDGNRWR